MITKEMITSGIAKQLVKFVVYPLENGVRIEIGISALCVTILGGIVLAFLTIKHTHSPVESRPYCTGGLQDGDQDLDSVVDSLVLCNSNFNDGRK